MSKKAKTKYFFSIWAIIAGVLVKVVLVARRGIEAPVKRIAKILNVQHVECKTIFDSHLSLANDYDMAIVVGEDKDVLRVLRSSESQLPILGVNEADGGGFLAEANVSNFQNVLLRLLKGDYRVEEARRIKVTVDGKAMPPALNEIAVFPSRSATLFEYALIVDGEVVWRDYSDGVIISTPTGSTAYAMSAGGPMILHDAPVFVVVSVNSMDITRRPLIASDSSKIEITNITSKPRCDAVIDGTVRTSVHESVEVSRHPQPARFVRLLASPKAMEKLAKKIRFAEDLLKMPASAKLILKTLEYEGSLSQKDLVRKTMLPDRTARMALNLLVEKGLVKRKPLLRDARHKLYHVA